MTEKELAEFVFEQWKKCDAVSKECIVRYALRNCGFSKLVDIWSFVLGVE